MAGEIVQLFSKWDTDGNGKITREELSQLMHFATNGTISDDMLQRLFDVADKNKDGIIDLEEFMTWMCSGDSGFYAKGVQPSNIPAAKSPVLLHALQDFFAAHDMNNNGRVDYEEFVLSHTLLQKNACMERVDADFRRMDVDGRKDLTWPEFFTEYSRLIDAIPQPLEEKVKLLRNRTKQLTEATCRSIRPADKSCRIINSSEEFLNLLRDRFEGSLIDAFFAMDEDMSGVLSIVEFRNSAERLLELPEGTRVSLECIRVLFREIDDDHSHTISLHEMLQTQQKRRTSRSSKRNSNRGSQAQGHSNPSNDDQGGDAEKPQLVPLHDILQHLKALFKQDHVEMQQRMLGKQLRETKSSDGKRLDQIQKRLDSLDQETNNHIWAFDFADSTRVMCHEFVAHTAMCLARLDPTFVRRCRQDGFESTSRLALKGWSPEELFIAIDLNGDGYVSMVEWSHCHRNPDVAHSEVEVKT